MNAYFKATITGALAIFLSFLVACGSGNTSMYCSPNYAQGGFGARITYLVGSLNTYEFQVCYNDNFAGSKVSVYGLETQGDIATINTSTDVRLPHMADGLIPGETFSVTFANDDTWFVIFEDDINGNFDTTSEIIRDQFR